MSNKRILPISTAVALGLALIIILTLALMVGPVSSQEPDESTDEAEKAAAAEQSQSAPARDGKGFHLESQADHPLFAGLSDIAVPAFRIEPATSDALQVFVGYQVWGAAYDYLNDQVYFSSATTLNVWPVGGSVTTLGVVSDTIGIDTLMLGLAFYDGTLYASKTATTGEGEGIYSVDPVTLQSTRVISYADPAITQIRGIDMDAATGILYGTNDDSDLRGLVQIDFDGTVTLVAPYLGGEVNVDGLAVGGGNAYLITDDQTPPTWDVYDLGVMTYTAVVTSPFTTTEVFAGGAWIEPAAPGQAEIELQKTVGTDQNVCASSDEIYVFAGTDVVYCYEVTNSGTLTLTNHFLDDSELGNLLNDFPFDLAPGISYWITESAQIDVTTVNSATWMACDQEPGEECASDSDTATVNIVTTASFPTCADFETGSLPGYMYPLATSNGGANGRVEVTTAFPNTGLYGLDIDTDCDECGGETLQSATMVIDLSGESNVELDFWVHEHGDENNPEDGVFISDDGGGTWAEILSLNDFPSSYENVSLDLAAAATDAGMNLVDGFQIRFQSMDNSWIPTDGYSFDDICVQEDLPEIDFEKTVGLDPSACALTDAIDVPAGTDVTYCYLVTNTGNFTFTEHVVVDAELGTSGFDFVLTPTISIWFTASATIDVTTVNTATWTAERPPPPGPGIEASDTDTATVTVVAAPLIEVDPDSLSSIQLPDVVVTKTLTISYVGDTDLDWLIEEAAPQSSCDAPSDIPWLGADPISGTLTALSGQDVDVTFDSTGVAPGLYTGTLCIESNDYYGRLVEADGLFQIDRQNVANFERNWHLD